MRAFTDWQSDQESQESLRKRASEILRSTAAQFIAQTPELKGQAIQESLGLTRSAIDQYIGADAESVESASEGFFRPTARQSHEGDYSCFVRAMFLQRLIKVARDEVARQLSPHLIAVLGHPVRTALLRRVPDDGAFHDSFLHVCSRPSLETNFVRPARKGLPNAIRYLVRCVTRARHAQDQVADGHWDVDALPDHGVVQRPAEARDRVTTDDFDRDAALAHRDVADRLFTLAIERIAAFKSRRVNAGAALLIAGGIAPTLQSNVAWAAAPDRMRPAFVLAMKALGDDTYMMDTLAPGLRVGMTKPQLHLSLQRLILCLARPEATTHDSVSEEELRDLLLRAGRPNTPDMRPEMAPLHLVRCSGSGAAQRCPSIDVPERIVRLGWPPGTRASIHRFHELVRGIADGYRPCLETAIATVVHMCACAPKTEWAELEYWTELLRVT